LTHGFRPSGFKGLMFGFEALLALLGDAFVDVGSGTSDFAGVEDELKRYTCQYRQALRSGLRVRLT
jgi:hypothetical protein